MDSFNLAIFKEMKYWHVQREPRILNNTIRHAHLKNDGIFFTCGRHNFRIFLTFGEKAKFSIHKFNCNEFKTPWGWTTHRPICKLCKIDCFNNWYAYTKWDKKKVLVFAICMSIDERTILEQDSTEIKVTFLWRWRLHVLHRRVMYTYADSGKTRLGWNNKAAYSG